MKKKDFLLSQLKKSKQSRVVSITEIVLFAEVNISGPRILCCSLCDIIRNLNLSHFFAFSWSTQEPHHGCEGLPDVSCDLYMSPSPALSFPGIFPYVFLSDFEGSLPFTLLADFFLPCSGSPCGSISISVVQLGPCLEYFGLPRGHAHLKEASIA